MEGSIPAGVMTVAYPSPVADHESGAKCTTRILTIKWLANVLSREDTVFHTFTPANRCAGDDRI
jgi:hypothetical protein